MTSILAPLLLQVHIYANRGLSEPLARAVAQELTDKDVLRAHARDELGLDLDELSNPLQVCHMLLLGLCCVSAMQPSCCDIMMAFVVLMLYHTLILLRQYAMQTVCMIESAKQYSLHLKQLQYIPLSLIK